MTTATTTEEAADDSSDDGGSYGQQQQQRRKLRMVAADDESCGRRCRGWKKLQMYLSMVEEALVLEGVAHGSNDGEGNYARKVDLQTCPLTTKSTTAHEVGFIARGRGGGGGREGLECASLTTLFSWFN